MWDVSTARTLVGSVAIAALAAIPILATVSSTARAQQRDGFDGRSIYRTYCAVCHGEGAKGDGPLAASLKVRPPDLTQFSKKHDGAFPRELVLRIVDGREPVKGHGGGDMPVWGDAFAQATENADPESVNRKIQAVVGYLEQLQAP